MHNAGHILGSSIAHFHIGDGLYNVAFTGDFKYERTRLFDPAVNNFPRLETLVMEATYGGTNSIQPSRKDAEVNLIKVVRDTIKRGGKVWIRLFPEKPITKKPAETRMGKGKGAPEQWVAVIRPGKVLFEMEGVDKATASAAMRLAAHKLAIKTRFISRDDAE